MEEYKKKFDEDYPLSFMQGAPEKNVMRIKECLANNQPILVSEYEHVLKSLFGDDFEK